MSNMVVVISDLHFEEEQSDIVKSADPDKPIALRRNVPSTVFEELVADVAVLARERQADKIEFVLAGDVFDLHRTQLWFSANFSSDIRPFVDNGQVGSGSPLEQKILEILAAIAAEEEVGKSLAVFRSLAEGKARHGEVTVDIGVPVTLHYLPGNHDRLLNATPALRVQARALLNLAGGDTPFPHNFMFTDPNVFIRHGHEYDPVNFGSKLRGWRIERDIRSELYDKATMGDFVTVQVASRLPNLFRARYDGEISTNPLLRTIYLRLLEFDDLRPQSAIVSFILDIWPPRELAERFRNKRDEWQALMWEKVEPVIRELLDDVLAALNLHPSVKGLLPWYARLLLPLRPWRWGIPLWVMHIVAWVLQKIDGAPQPYRQASREQALDDGADFVAAGHTHAPEVAHLFTGKGGRKKYFVDTGTWRNAVLGSFRRSYFGRVNATTYVAFFGPKEELTRSFEFRSGMRQRWPVDESDR